MTGDREIVVRLQLEYPPAPPALPAPAEDDRPLLYTVGDAARVLAIGDTLLYELIARGEIESVKIGAARRITRAELEAYVRRLAERSAGEP